MPQARKNLVYESFKKKWNRDRTATANPIDYASAVSAWKERDDLKHIKCAKYKEGFSKCEVCSQYEQESLKQLHVADMLNLDA